MVSPPKTNPINRIPLSAAGFELLSSGRAHARSNFMRRPRLDVRGDRRADLGSGMHYHKKGVKWLLDDVVAGPHRTPGSRTKTSSCA